ncbi:MAG: MarR family winged helix-turn-helix transcriptional regulator [Pseudomonadota bacterium]
MSEEDPDRIDHIGWRLWQAASDWKARFAESMVAAGHPWYGEARSAVIPFIGPDGVRQQDLVRKIGLTKQAVQQLVDDLERDGILRREPDPVDRRGRVIKFTEEGRAVLRAANRVKRDIESAYRRDLGPRDFETLFHLLGRLEGGRGTTDRDT